jgi:hypothetical protein
MSLWQQVLVGIVAVPIISWWIEAIQLVIRVRRWRKGERS